MRVGVAQGWVVFSGRTGLRRLAWLKPGFRHCFLVWRDGEHWLTLDPLAHALEVAVQPVPSSFDLPGWYRSQGLVVVPARAATARARPGPMPGLLTCVTVVRHALGLREWWVQTPWQLCRHLQRRPVEAGPRTADALRRCHEDKGASRPRIHPPREGELPCRQER